MKIFLIADPHFGHENIIKYCNRPFRDVDEMNNTIVKNWNLAVRKEDKVFVLGDFALRRENVSKFGKILNGKKILIKGNHDCYPNSFYIESGFEDVVSYPILYDGFCLFSHEPLALSETTPYFNFYGHVHNDAKFIDNSTSKCVSIERLNYSPYLYKDTSTKNDK